MSRTRNERIEIRLSAEEAKMLRALVKRSGLSATDVVRQMIRRESEVLSSAK